MSSPLSTWYALGAPCSALERLVDTIEANPGQLIQAHELAMELDSARLEAAALRATLPPGMTESDLHGVLHLALLTECATESYAGVFENAARRFGAPWLGRFTRNVWVPDELTHHAPFRALLLYLGSGEADLDRAVRVTQSLPYEHTAGDTPMHLTTFGMLQEYLTDNWYRHIVGLLRPSAPGAAASVLRIKRRETLHTVWYRNMTALQLEANPRLLGHVGEALVAFRMPGNSLVPELQSAAAGWLAAMGGDVDVMRRDLVRLVAVAVADVERTGTLLIQIAAAFGERFGPISPRYVRAALDRLGGPGYGLVGEALLERVGLGDLFRTRSASRENGECSTTSDASVDRVRGLLRRWLAAHIELDLGTPMPTRAAPTKEDQHGSGILNPRHG